MSGVQLAPSSHGSFSIALAKRMPSPETQGYEVLAPRPVRGEGRLSSRRSIPTSLLLAVAATAAAVVVISIALGTSRTELPPFSFARQSTQNSAQRSCASLDLSTNRNNGSFWIAEAIQSRTPELVIRPKDAAFEGCFGAALASFSVVVHYGDELHALKAATFQDPLGVYHYDAFPPALRAPSAADAIFGIHLDFGYYPAAEDGQPCTKTACAIEEVARTGVAFSGEEILNVEGERARLHLDNRPLRVGAPPRPCQQLDPLHAAFFEATNTFAYAAADGARCAIRTVGSDLPYQPPLRWIQVLGDSNSRYLVTQLADMLNLTLAAEYTAANEKHPTTRVFHDGTGSGIVLAFEWVFVRQDPSGARNLAAIELSSLEAYLASIPFADPPTWPASYLSSPVGMTDLFFSYGSHAPALTQLGMRAGIERLRPGLEERFALARNRHILLTAATEPSKVPAVYGPQWAMRNNLNIDIAQNAVAREFAASVRAAVVDYFTMTRSIPIRMTRDPVHFETEVYAAQADLLWTAMHLADERKLEGIDE